MREGNSYQTSLRKYILQIISGDGGVRVYVCACVRVCRMFIAIQSEYTEMKMDPVQLTFSQK